MPKKQVQICVIPGESRYDWLQLAADSFARLQRLLGRDAYFSVCQNEFTRVFKISADEDCNPTDSSSVVSHLLKRLQQAGAVYKQVTACNLCQDCGRPQRGSSCICGGQTVRAEGVEGYFFRSEAQAQAIMELVNDPSIVMPGYQRQDLVNSFTNKNIEDVLVAVRSGVGRDLQPSLWLQRLAQVLGNSGFPGDEGSFSRLWTETYVFIPRELAETIYNWCGIISALALPAPGGLICHSPLEIADNKGQDVSPILLAQNYGTESLRYFLLGMKMTAGENTFTEEQVIQQINLDLANELGNLVSRIISLVTRFSQGVIPRPDILTRQTGDLDLRESALATPGKIEAYIHEQELHLAVKAIKDLIGQANRFIEATMPWQLASSPQEQPRLNTVLYNLCEVLRFLAVCLKPLLPEAAANILQQMGLADSLSSWNSLRQWGLVPVNTRVTEQPALFPRIVPGYGELGPEPDLVMREELARIRMVVARVVSAEPVADYDGLLQLVLYDGRQRRRVLAPVAHSHNADHLSGRKVIMVSNLNPVEVGGAFAEGEVVILESGGNLELVFVDDEVAEGSKVLCLS